MRITDYKQQINNTNCIFSYTILTSLTLAQRSHFKVQLATRNHRWLASSPRKDLLREFFTGHRNFTPTAALVTKVRNSKYFRSALYSLLVSETWNPSYSPLVHGNECNRVTSFIPEPTFDEEESVRARAHAIVVFKPAKCRRDEHDV